MGVVGVEITTSLRAGPSNPTGPESARFYITGITERGPVNGTQRVRSIAEFEQFYGPRTAFSGSMYDAAQVFFEEGGAELYPCRVVGPAATKGALTINDRAGSPLPTLQVQALQPGAWSTDLAVQVVDGTAANTFGVRVFYKDVLVETWGDFDTVANAATLVNLSSKWVKLVDQGSATAYPARRPAVTAKTALAAGADDRASVNATIVAAGLNLADRALGPGAVAAPGYTATQVGAALIAHAKANRRVALLAGNPDSDDAELQSMAAALTTDGEYGAVFGPYLLIPDGSGARRVSPEAYVAAVRARAQLAVGFWQAPPGQRSAARFVLGPVRSITQAANDVLAVARVNAARTISGGTRLYGWRSLSTNPELALLSARDTLNAIEGAVEDVLEEYVFRTIDGTGRLLAEVKGALVGVLQPIASAGGLFPRTDQTGKEIDPGYRVQVDPVVVGNQISATVAVRLSPTAELIRVSIVKAALSASV